MNTNNYLPFDLETALKHPERVVTRDGRNVQELHCFKTMEGNYPLFVLLNQDKSIATHTIDGKRLLGYEDKTDLFLLPEVKECWVNVYDDGSSIPKIGDGRFGSKERAKELIYPMAGTYIKTIRITNEPE